MMLVLTTVFMDTRLGTRSGLALPQGILAHKGAPSSEREEKYEKAVTKKKENTIQ